MCTAYIIKMAVTAASCVFIIFLGFSRVYLGAHSYNQVIFGFAIGLYFAYAFHFHVKKYYLEQTMKF